MSTNYFAHGVFGVHVDDENDINKLEEVWNRALAHCGEEVPTAEIEDEFRKLLKTDYPKLEKQLRGNYLVPKDAKLCFTGRDNDHPGRSHTSAECWLLGYGLLSFPGKVPKKFTKKGKWFLWVTADS